MVHVESMFGAHTRQGLVKFQIGEKEVIFTILEAKRIAYMILECAESAFVDETIWKFFQDKLGMPKEEVASLLYSMRQARGKVDTRFFEE